MADNTSGGTTASLSNTPQAKADTFYRGEDLTGITMLDVMLNDLAGNAKILWSVDDSATDAAGATDLVCTDIGKIEATSTDTSANGAKIWIQDGKVAYQSDSLNAAFKAALQALAVGQTITDTFTYAIRMSNGTLSWNTATIVFTGANDGPVANADSNDADLVTEAGVNPGNVPFPGNPSASGNVLANDTDVDNGAVLTVKEVNGSTANVGNLVPGAYGSVTINGNGSWTYNLDNGDDDTQALAQGESVTETFSYMVTDEHGATSTSTLTITIIGTNDGPVANPDSGSTSENATVLVDVLANDTDVDNGHTLTVVSANAPVGQGSASIVGNQVEFDPGADFDHLAVGDSVVVTVSYTIEDEHGASSSSTIDITVTGTNDAPELSASLTGHTYLDTSADDSFGNVSGTLSTDDPDDDDTAAYSIDGGVADDSRPGFNISSSSAYGTLYLDSTTGAYEFVPADGTIEGLKSDDSVSFTLTVTDSQGASDSETLTINLDGANDTPEAPPTNSVTTDEDNASAATAIGASDRDAGEVLTYSVKSGGEPDHGSVSFDQAAGTFVYAPDANYHGGDSFTILVTDASGATTEQIVDVTVNSVNDAPAAAGTNSVTTDEDNASGAVVIGASDVDGDTLTYSVKPGGDPAHGSVSFDQVAGTFVYTPDPNYNGDDNFTILIDDGNGGTAEQVVGVTVNPVNDAPTSANGSNSTDEDQALNSTLPAAADVDGDSVAYALGTNAANGNAVVNADGTFSYTPNPDFNGSDSFTFTVSDGNGGSNSYTYEVTVNPVNDAPNSANGSNSTDEDQPLNGSLPAASDVDGDSVTYSLDANAANGNAVVNADGTFSYTPNPDFNGSDSFTFTVSDGNGGSNTYAYEVTVNPVNDAAVITGDDSGTVVEDTIPNSVSGNLDSTDVDNDDDSWSAVVSATASASGFGT